MNTPTKTIIIVLLVFAIGIFTLSFLRTQGVPQQPFQTPTEPTPTASDRALGEEAVDQDQKDVILVTLNELNNSGETGIATLREEDGRTKVTIRMIGFSQGANQPAHIHAGVCPTPGQILYTLAPVADGSSETFIDTTFSNLFTGQEMAINVHKSAQALQVYTACGDLPQPSPATTP